ncbi:uncharacterized protein PV09_00224 [Verruconis gallopava]|uniref:Probable beta-glucosidase G n=1 Tax=Verruconis gallopava TaxID=253628 RepID=A0A0D2BCZ5_9PEZI|nr:uncharacterized protein PV09_00224 [Verruconis gallopava]KIW09309.1 hypothetical protein PV09_00224 [Verruconis gallopava]
MAFLSLFLVGASLVSAQQWNHSLYTSSPPVYPSPNATGAGDWDAAFAQAKSFVSMLTLEEKAGMVTGTTGPCVGNIAPIDRLGFNGLCLNDGPAGLREITYGSVFPAGLTAAASWDRNLIRSRGQDMGEEFRGKGSHIALGPVCGPLGRSPFSGRNWEGFSPDPYLTGVAVEETILGIQSAGVQATVKHFIGNEQETQRNPSIVDGVMIDAVSSNIDDKTMHELYLWPFANAVHSGVSSVMCSYNRLNESYSCQNSKVLNGLLKDELDFQGYVMSDWSATHTGLAAIEAGLDMNIPGGISFLSPEPSFFGGNITIAVKNGSLPESRLDDMILRVMTPYYYLKQDQGFPLIDPSIVPLNFFAESTWVANFNLNGTSNRDVRGNHGQLIRELGAAGTVLLKNTNNTLPLKAPKNIGVFGNDAGDLTQGLYSLTLSSLGNDPYGYEFGTLDIGGGSGTGRHSFIVSPLEAIKARAAQDGAIVQYILDNSYLQSVTSLEYITPIPDVCIVFTKTWASEGEDRIDLSLNWNASTVVANVAAVCPNTVVVTHSSGPNDLPFASNPNVTAILAAHYPGEETGNSIVDILWGDVNPSGKLPYTIALNSSDYNTDITNSTELVTSTDPNAWQSDFTEGVFIDYRYFDKANKSVLYEFGFGLSYTSFGLSSLQVQSSSGSLPSRPNVSAGKQPGGNPELWQIIANVTVTVTNTGQVAGAAVPQLYVSLPGEDEPVKVLRGFDKIMLQPGESQPVNFPLMRRDLSSWDVDVQDWVLASGNVGLLVGFSSRDIVLTGSLTL